MRQLTHWLLVLLVYVLKIDMFQLALSAHYREAGMTDDASAVHMDAMRRKVFLITAVACVVAMGLGYTLSKFFAGSVVGTAGWWLLFFAMVIGAFQFKKREGREVFSFKSLREVLRRR